MKFFPDRELIFDHYDGTAFKILLTRMGAHASLRDSFSSHVKSLQHNRFQSHARKHYSSARYGQEERRRRAPCHEKCAAFLRAEPAFASHLGAGAEEVCSYSRYRPRAEDDQQERRVSRVEKSRRDLNVATRLRRVSYGPQGRGYTGPSQLPPISNSVVEAGTAAISCSIGSATAGIFASVDTAAATTLGFVR